jgi:protoporphyrin/coproporphyrin ferrochelatase
MSYDALILISYGGPEGMDDVMPFLRNVLEGKRVPEARMREVAHHYELFGGVSPLNAQNQALIAAIEDDFAEHSVKLPVYWGNRNWQPYLVDTLRQMQADGIKRALAFFTSPYSSYSSCRQYLEDIDRARAEIGDGAPEVHKLRAYFNHPGFIQPNIDNFRAALDQIPADRRDAAHVVFTAHSIPLAMARGSAYEAQLQTVCRLVTGDHPHWCLVYQSRSGPPHQPWLEPDVGDYLRQLYADGVTDVVVMPIGFISDHMEVLYDLDTEAEQIAGEIGLNMVRAATVGTHPTFVQMIRELVLERQTGDAARRYLGAMGPSHDVCPADCCLLATVL